MSADESDGPLFAVVVNGVAALLGLTADSSSWPIRIAAVAIGLAIGFAVGWKWKASPWQLVATLVFVLAVSAAMITGTITGWLGFTAIMSGATGSTIRQVVDLRRSR